MRGLETSAQARLDTGLAIEFGAAWNHSELVREATFFWADGTPIDFATLRTRPADALESCRTAWSPLAGAPPFQGNVASPPGLDLGGYEAFAQVGVVHQAHSNSRPWIG